MNIELKRISVSERLSEETTAFRADLHIEGIKVGEAYNHGTGGATFYNAHTVKGQGLINKAEAYCKQLPDRVYPDITYEGKPLTVKMDLENYIDDLLTAHMEQKELARFRKELNKQMEKHIVVGVPDESYHRWSLKFPVTLLLQHPRYTEQLENLLKEKIIPSLKKGEVILNTNLPADMMERVGFPYKKEEAQKEVKHAPKAKQSKGTRHKK